MGADEWSDPHDIIPKQFREEFGDCETVADALKRAENRPSTTPLGERPRCPECESFKAWPKVSSVDDKPNREPGAYRCHTCQAHFDEPLYSTMIPKNNPRTRAFDWIADDDLVDADERTALEPPLAGVDEETRTAVVILLHRPWSDDGATYREIAPFIPHSRYWVGRRVRAWRDGEYRDLVPDPRTADETAGDEPTVDDAPAATATATDGGRERRRRRLDAFGG